jgi:hypothetical protein
MLIIDFFCVEGDDESLASGGLVVDFGVHGGQKLEE